MVERGYFKRSQGKVLELTVDERRLQKTVPGPILRRVSEGKYASQLATCIVLARLLEQREGGSNGHFERAELESCVNVWPPSLVAGKG
jgi:hypothetical protein